MEKRNHVLTIIWGYILSALFLLTPLFAQNSKDVALILKASGDVKVRKESAKKWEQGKRGERLDSGDIIKTFDNSLAAIMFTDDKSLLKVRDNSILAIKGKREKKSISKRIVCSLGNFWIKVSKQKTKLLVETPSGVAAVKGTEFYGIVDEDGNTTIIAIEGIVQLMNKFGEQLVKGGQTGKMDKSTAPDVSKTDPNAKQDWAKSDSDKNELQFEFKDSEGNKKHLKIIYE